MIIDDTTPRQTYPGQDDGRPPRIYYRRADIRVTQEHLVVPGQHYAISELDELWTVRPRIRILRTVFIFVGANIAIVACGLSYLHTTLDSAASAVSKPLIWAAFAVLSMLIETIGAGVLLVRAKHRPYELWARYRGTEVRLVVIPDARTHGQVSRALLRACEAREVG